MQQYQVPQFITVEDKVIGPFTVKQFIFLVAGIAVIVLAKMFLVTILFIPITMIVGAFVAALAFLKINEQPFPSIVKNGIYFFFHPRLYVWRKEPQKTAAKPETAAPQVAVNTIPKLSQSKLSDLAWSLNIKEKTRSPGQEDTESDTTL